MADKIIGNVFETKNYDMFQKLDGNRSINMKIINRIIKSIKEVGQIFVPVTVNEKYEVIDGQNRIEAFKEMNLPVWYVISPGTGIQECISLNINQTPWKQIDYIESYANRGNESYIMLKNILSVYPMFPCETIVSAIKGKKSGSRERRTGKRNGFVTKNLIEQGEFQCTEEDIEKAKDILDILVEFV